MKQSTLFPLKPVLACRDKSGSVAGHQRHQRTGEAPCELCRLAYNTYYAQKNYRSGLVAWPKPKPQAPRGYACLEKRGTVAGRGRHVRADEKPCQECGCAINEANNVSRSSPEKREANNKKSLEYKKTPRGKAVVASSKHRRRARKRNALSTPYDDPALLPGARCWFCGRTDDNECDHLISFERGGIDTKSNTGVLCGGEKGCNQRKGTGDYIGDVRVTPEYSYLREDSPDPSVYTWLDDPISAAERQRFLSGETQGGETSLAEYPPEAA